MSPNSTLSRRLQQVRQRIESACRSAGREPAEVTLLAVSKTRSAAEIEALKRLGPGDFGENYLDEAAAKQDVLADSGVTWHFIGPVQSNKTRELARRFDWVQSVDREKIARRLADQRPDDRAPLNVLIQVNIDREPQKAGCQPEQLDALADFVSGCDALRLRGLMAIPAADHERDETRRAFSELRSLHARLADRHDHVDTLSMGMSGDLEDAITEGSTMIRVGTALFGPRGS